ncbi:helix-turn-helix domain-containing protein [Methanocaldococcus indicus]|uniref:helix-turn-helix domain-containing protein n=1 Tax=Methanocaldococcus indicus TaxID=213231 RepID=UPI003C6D7C16
MYDKLEIIERAILLNPMYIQIFRERLKITQSKLAKESGISQSHLSMLEKGKRKPTKLIAAAITYGLLKCFSERNIKNPVYELLDTLSLLKFEDNLIELINNIILEENRTFLRYINGHSYIILDKNNLLREMRNKLKVIEIIDIVLSRGKIVAYGKYIEDNKDVIIELDCSDIRRLEKKFYEKYNKKIIIQVFPKGEVPPIYNIEDNCIIVHCW